MRNFLRKWLGIDELERDLRIKINNLETKYIDLYARYKLAEARLDNLGLELQEHDHEAEPEPEPVDPYDTPPLWAIQKYIDPQLTTLEYGITWAKFTNTERKALRIPNNVAGDFPLMEPPSPESGKRVYLEPGTVFIAYRKSFQGAGDVYIEVCDPVGQAIEWKWVEFLGKSSTGR